MLLLAVQVLQQYWCLSGWPDTASAHDVRMPQLIREVAGYTTVYTCSVHYASLAKLTSFCLYSHGAEFVFWMQWFLPTQAPLAPVCAG
jgi:hypothetical protein